MKIYDPSLNPRAISAVATHTVLLPSFALVGQPIQVVVQEEVGLGRVSVQLIGSFCFQNEAPNVVK